MDATTSRLVEFAGSARFDALSTSCLHACKQRLIDTVGGAFGAYHERLSVMSRAVAQRAAGLMRHYAGRWPKLRAIDVMHVSAAVESGAKTFLSFDTRSYQRVLAHTQKLKVWPALTAEEAAHLK